MSLRLCSNPTCGKAEESVSEFKNCSGCKKTQYCGKDCQIAHWKGGHKGECKVAKKETVTTEVSKKDMERISKEVTDLESKLRTYVRQLREVNAQLMSAERNSKRSALTEKELSEIPSSNNMYRTVGKMFMLQSKPDIIKHLATKAVKDEEDAKNLKNQFIYFESKVNETESNIQEIMRGISVAQ